MGGHGGLNILPQKSWNVYNRDNRQKVERDEAEAAAAATESARAAASQRMQANVEEMRARRAEVSGEASAAPLRHVNFFEAEELARGNEAAAAEARAADARATARLMPDLQLGRSAAEPRPWYANITAPALRPHGAAATATTTNAPALRQHGAAASAAGGGGGAVGGRSPALLAQPGSQAAERPGSIGRRDSRSRSRSPSRDSSGKKKRKKEKKEKRKRKRRREDDESEAGRRSGGGAAEGGGAALARLREERRRREMLERRRADEVLLDGPSARPSGAVGA